MIRAALADDQLLFRRGMVLMLRDMPEIDVVLECANGEELFIGLAENEVDIVLLDMQMPVMDGLATLKELRAKWPTLKVIVLSGQEEEKYVAHALELGANGYLLKSAEPEEIEDGIGCVMQHGFYFNATVDKVMLHGLVKKQNWGPVFNDLDPLSDREMEVLQGICAELTTTEIAGKLFLSPRTVEFHRNNLLQKTGARNVAGLVVIAMTKGLFTPA